MSVFPSVQLHGSARLPQEGFSSNFIFGYFWKIYRENSVSLKSDINSGYFTWRPI